jgi:hypothetical protein
MRLSERCIEERIPPPSLLHLRLGIISACDQVCIRVICSTGFGEDACFRRLLDTVRLVPVDCRPDVVIWEGVPSVDEVVYKAFWLVSVFYWS